MAKGAGGSREAKISRARATLAEAKRVWLAGGPGAQRAWTMRQRAERTLRRLGEKV